MIPDESMRAATDPNSGGMGPRPWTITALLVVFVVSTVWGFIFGADSVWSNLIGFVLGGGLMYAIWRGKTWAFLLTLGLTAFAFVMFGIIFFVVRPAATTESMIPSFVLVAAQLGLLMHPETKRYAGIRRNRQTAEPSEPTATAL